MAGALLVAGGVAAGQSSIAWKLVAGSLVLGLLTVRRVPAALVLVVAVVAGWGADARALGVDAAQGGALSVEATVVSDPAPAATGWAFVARVEAGRLAGTRIAVLAAGDEGLRVGERVAVSGDLSVKPSRLHRNDVIGWLRLRSNVRLDAPGLALRPANAIRARVHSEFSGADRPGALMRGLLIGDTASLSGADLDDMRRAGLLHFVAVSGGNVAVFLATMWLAAGLLLIGPRSRAALGLAAIFLFVLVTRWEPSVVRAGLMVGLVLLGRLSGVPVDGWSALGSAVGISLLVAPQLVFETGFQLSVVATGGLLLGSHLWSDRRPLWLWRALGATLAAQLAVTPILLYEFDSVPAFAVVANVVGAPLVSAAVALGWARVLFTVPFAGSVAELIASVLLELARWSARLPQVGWLGAAGLVLLAVVLRRLPRSGLFAVAIFVVGATASGSVPPGPGVVFLDVGQGDAILLVTSSGRVVAVDTGPDPAVYSEALRRNRIERIDLLILTHGDRDHVGGLAALRGRVGVLHAWYPAYTGEDWREHLDGITMDRPLPVGAGHRSTVDELTLTVLGPARRFAADNDGSVVLWVEAPGGTVLLAGDIEGVAQAELPSLSPDVLLVPHHGSTTTDVGWLRRTVGPLAILSYGVNEYGHPAPEIVAALESAGAAVRHTAHGDVVVGLGSSAVVGSQRP